MNAKTEIPRATLQADLIQTVDYYNPIFDLDPQVTMLNVGSVLEVVKRFVNDDEHPGVKDDESIGIGLIVQCCIDALNAQNQLCDLQERAKKEGGAA